MKRLPILTVRALSIALLTGAATSACTATSSSSYYDACDPEVPDAECYATRRDPESEQIAQATRIAIKYIESHPAEEHIWDWKAGVLMHSLNELYRVTGDERLRQYYQSYLDYHIELGYRMQWSDDCPPAIAAVALWDETEEQKYLDVVDDVLEYLDDIAPRTAEGGISHNGVLAPDTLSVWLDSLFMFGMVLNRWGEVGDPDRLDMMSEQIQIFADVLQNDDGFMRHAQDWPGYDETVIWTRGNSWVVASLADYLRIRVRSQESDSAVENVFRKHVDAILSAQQDDGMWQTVISHPDEVGNYLETSGSALFAYGVLRAWRYGLLNEEQRRLAEKTVARIVEEWIVDDLVTGVSLATDPWQLRSPTGGEDGYLDVPIGDPAVDDVSYGVGAVILALVETSGLPE